MVTAFTPLAGHAFWGVVLATILKANDSLKTLLLEQITKFLNFANAAGSLATINKGAIPAMPDKIETRNCMKNIPRCST
jgi:sugar/nucleoside kinase (ribokinase family)